MSQKDKPTYCSNLVPKSTKIFTYKGESYNVDFNLMKRSCKYFYDNRSEIKDKEFEIEISIDLPPETIQAFLNCCQNLPTQINDIFGINYLSIKYQNEDLMKFTNDYIESNFTTLIFQSIYLKQQIQDSNDIHEFEFDTTNEERIISMHFLEYIDDEKIFSLPINIIHRVLKKFLSENKEICNNTTTKKKISNFLMNCLRKYKRGASILFGNVGFDIFDRELIVSLHNEFSDIFDFSMIDSKSLFETTYELIGEIAQIRSLLKIISDQQTSQKNEFNDYKLKFDQENNQKDEKINELIKNKNYLKEQISQIKEEIKNLKSEQKNLKEAIKQKEEIINMEFSHKEGNEFNGIFKYLTEKTGGIISKNGTISITSSSIYNNNTPQNLVDFASDKYFYAGLNDTYFWVCFDFKNMEVELTSYTIKSNNWTNGHIKTWVMEISDDGSNWQQIDHRENNSSLKNPLVISSFNVRIKKFSRYFRFHHTGDYWEGSGSGFNSIEFYGRLKIHPSK